MDRPFGPRPDKRNAAYESIFGRPSAAHHRPQQPQYIQPPHAYAYHNQQSYSPRHPQQPARQSYPQGAPQGNVYYQQHYDVYQQYPRSLASSSHSPGVIVPQPQHDGVDPALEALTRAGMTPAQAYQAQVYLRSPASHDPIYNQQPAPLQDSPRRSLYGPREPREANTPRIAFDGSDGRLEIDFGDSSPSNPGTDEGADHDSQSSPNFGDGSSVLTDNEPHEHYAKGGQPTRPYPLQLDTTIATATPPSVDDHSPGSLAEHGSPTLPTVRRSPDSTRTMPRPTSLHRDRTVQDRNRSISSLPQSQQSQSTLVDLRHASRPSQTYLPPPSTISTPISVPDRDSQRERPRRSPVVYAALLSRVAEAFRQRITLAERGKDGLSYADAFDGREAVDKIAYIIKTTDRNLALLLGRALDAQKFFHDVTYDHRLRDSPYELYQFRSRIPSPFVSGEIASASAGQLANGGREPQEEADEVTPETGTDPTLRQRPRSGSTSSDEAPLPSGVFTLLTDCYSPTCTRDSLCYSIACPRRLEQQARLNLKPQQVLKRSISKESLGDLVEPGTLWIHSVPQEIVDSVSDLEKKRQEAINEVMYTERDFVRDMEYLRDVWITPLKNSDIIPEDRRMDFLQQVFWNVNDIIAVNTRLRDALTKRQKSYAVVERIADILLDAIPHFDPFVSYGSHQLYGKYEFEKEKSSNPLFQKFVDETERLPESRKLELNGYLTKPTTRLARYPLLLEVVLKYTPDENPDKQDLPKAVALVREFLQKVNIESGKTENRFNLLQLDQQLVFRPGEEVDLRLREEGRELVYKGNLRKRGGSGQSDGDLQLFLFDHALLMVKQKTKHEQYKVYRRPIPLELLLICTPDDGTSNGTVGRNGKHQKIVSKRNSFGDPPSHLYSGPNHSAHNGFSVGGPGGGVGHSGMFPVKQNKDGFAITFVHLGRKYYQITLWAPTIVARKKWVEHIQKQQEMMRERSMVFDMVTLSEGFFLGPNKVNCATPFHGGRRVAFGTNDGVYFSDARDRHRDPVRVLALMDVTQVDILEMYGLLIVLSEHQVITFPLGSLSEHDPTAGLRRAKRISSHTSFFKAGVCLGRTLVCVVKASQLSSTIKALEPIEQEFLGKNKPTFRKLLQGGHDTLRSFREFYIPVESSSVHFLKTKLCVGCTKGFEIVDLETLDTQALLDPSDASLDFVQRRDDVRPMAIYRIENDFLLCYDEFAFYVNKNGWRARSRFVVHWEGHPRSFALHYPYVLAFEPTFIEVRHVETGAMMQIIQGNNLRCLFAETPPSTTHGSYQQLQHPLPPLPPTNADPRYMEAMMRQTSHSSRSSNSHSPYSAESLPSYHTYPQQQPAIFPYNNGRPSGFARDEIILVSDDRVMALQLAVSDSASFTSR